jgi:hypothetical protein
LLEPFSLVAPAAGNHMANSSGNRVRRRRSQWSAFQTSARPCPCGGMNDNCETCFGTGTVTGTNGAWVSHQPRDDCPLCGRRVLYLAQHLGSAHATTLEELARQRGRPTRTDSSTFVEPNALALPPRSTRSTRKSHVMGGTEAEDLVPVPTGARRRELVACPRCAAMVRADHLARHLSKVHSARRARVTQASTYGHRTALRRCPHCGANVRQDRLSKHVARVHGASLEITSITRAGTGSVRASRRKPLTGITAPKPAGGRGAPSRLTGKPTGWTRTCRHCHSQYPYCQESCPKCGSRAFSNWAESGRGTVNRGGSRAPVPLSGAKLERNESRTVMMPWTSQLGKVSAVRKMRLEKARRAAPPEPEPHSVHTLPGGRPDSNRRRH